jgi:hypothetical protein
MININLKEIFPVDNQSDLSAKLNFNFNQLLALGFGERGETGPAGEIGPIGPIGPIGVAGDPGSQIFSVIGEPGSPPANPSEAVIGDYFISDTGIFKKSTASEWNLISNFTDIFTDIASASLLSWQLGVKDPNSLSKILVPINNSAGIDRGNGVPGVSVDFSTNDPNWYNDDDAKSNSQVTIFNFDPQTTKTYEANSGQNGYGVTIQTNRIGDAVDDSVFPYTALLSLYSFYNISDSSTEALQFDNITGYRHQLELGSVDDAVEELVTDNPDAQYVISPTWQNLRIRKYRRTSSQPGGLIINADFNLSSADTSQEPALNSRFTWRINKKGDLAQGTGKNITLSLSNQIIEADPGNRLTGIPVDGLHLQSDTYNLAIGIDPTNNASTIKNAIIASNTSLNTVVFDNLGIDLISGTATQYRLKIGIDPLNSPTRKNAIIKSDTTSNSLDTVVFEKLGIVTNGVSGTSSFTTDGITSTKSIVVRSTGTSASGDIIISASGNSGTNGGSVFVVAPNPNRNIYIGFSTSGTGAIADSNWTTSSGYALKIKRNRLDAGIPFPVSTSASTATPTGNSVDPNVLDEYQERTFTPSVTYNPEGLAFPTAAAGVLFGDYTSTTEYTYGQPTIGDQFGTFTKVGNTVNFTVVFSISYWQAVVGKNNGTSGGTGYTYGTSGKFSSAEDMVKLDYGNLSTANKAPAKPLLGAEPWQLVVRNIPDHWPDMELGQPARDSLKFNVNLRTYVPYELTPPLRGNPFTYSYKGAGTAGTGTSAEVKDWGTIDPASIHARFGRWKSGGTTQPQLELWGNRQNFDTVTVSGTSVLRFGQASSIPSRVSIYDFLTPYPGERKVYVTISGSYITSHKQVSEFYPGPLDPVPVDDGPAETE